MKSYACYISLLLLACLGIASCNEHEWGETEAFQGIELTVSCGNLEATRATMSGEEEYNENVIRTLHYFFYLSGKTDENAVMRGTVTLDEGTKDQAIVRIPLNDTELNSVVFPRPANECEVYLIANLPSDVTLPTYNTSLNNLKALAVTANFKEQMPQSSFVMEGTGKAVIGNRNNTVAANGSIELKRLAAKLTTRISVEETFEDTDGKVWRPVIDQMTVTFDNAVSNTTLGGARGSQRFNYEDRTRMGTKTEDNKTLYVFSPFYSYPCTWDYRDEKALVMYVMLPWVCEENGSSRYEDCYYKVFPGTMQLDCNSWYNMDLHIGVLGSFSPTEEPIEIKDFAYRVVDWTNGFDDWTAGLEIETEILSAHYLVVERNDYVVNNKNEFDIPFITSHKCIIKNLKVTRTNFGTDNNKPPVEEDITNTAQSGDWLTLNGNVIKLNHELNNDFINTTNYDYSPYVFTFTLCHENNPNFYEEITITQKPAISITAQLNSYREQYPNGTNGYQFVNGIAAGSSGNYTYGGAIGLSGQTKNPYMYVIEITVLPAGSDYILGDPRSETPATPQETQGLDFSHFRSAPGVEGTASRTLTKYYSTNKDKSVENMIAPKFRIASSHGTVSSFITYNDAFNRAATYQEDGYPAGRWRVPTLAEVRFVAKLFADGKIPALFNSGTGYWCATGRVTPSNGGGVSITDNTSGTYTIRSVYDEWYWEQSAYPRLTNYNVFTWGDEIN